MIQGPVHIPIHIVANAIRVLGFVFQANLFLDKSTTDAMEARSSGRRFCSLGRGTCSDRKKARSAVLRLSWSWCRLYRYNYQGCNVSIRHVLFLFVVMVALVAVYAKGHVYVTLAIKHWNIHSGRSSSHSNGSKDRNDNTDC